MSLIEKSNTKAGSRLDKRMRVFDIYDGKEEKEDEEIDDVSAEYEDDEYDDIDYEE